MSDSPNKETILDETEYDDSGLLEKNKQINRDFKEIMDRRQDPDYKRRMKIKRRRKERVEKRKEDLGL